MNVQDVLQRIVGPVNFVLICQSLVVLGRKRRGVSKEYVVAQQQTSTGIFIVIILSLIRSFYKEHTSAQPTNSKVTRYSTEEVYRSVYNEEFSSGHNYIRYQAYVQGGLGCSSTPLAHSNNDKALTKFLDTRLGYSWLLKNYLRNTFLTGDFQN